MYMYKYTKSDCVCFAGPAKSTPEWQVGSVSEQNL